MSDPFLGEIQIVGFNYAPVNWAFCLGQTVSIAQNMQLYSLIQNRYGGDGVTVFNLPNLVARAPIHYGAGPGLSSYDLAATAGVNTVTLIRNELPPHRHGMSVANGSGQRQATPATGRALSTPGQSRIFTPDSANVAMSALGITASGGSGSHNNMQPYLALNMCIALQGVIPTFD